MRIKTVTFSQSIETVYGYGLKKWTKAASEIEFDEEKDNPDNAYALAKQLVKEQIAKELTEHTEMMGTKVTEVVENTKEKEDQIKNEYFEIEAKLNEFEFQEDAIAYLNTTTFKHYIPAKQIANSKPIKNK